MPTSRTRTVVITVVTVVWALNFAAGLVPPLHYKPDQAINGIFMAIVGGIFAYGAVKDRSNDDDARPPRQSSGRSPSRRDAREDADEPPNQGGSVRKLREASDSDEDDLDERNAWGDPR